METLRKEYTFLMIKDRTLKVAYGAGLFMICLVCASDFSLRTYKGGGVEEYRGRLPNLEAHFPPGHDYILYKRGKVTPISKSYYDLIQKVSIPRKVRSIKFIAWFVSLLVLLAGLAAYEVKLREPLFKLKSKRDLIEIEEPPPPWYTSSYFNLLFPAKGDPLITLMAKIYLVLQFVAIVILSVLNDEGVDETGFIYLLIVIHALIFLLSLAGALAFRRLGTDTAVSQDEKPGKDAVEE